MFAPVIGTILLVLVTLGSCVSGIATHYGISYQGGQMGCPGSGLYDSADPSIIAVGYGNPLGCGDRVVVVGPAGSFLGVVQDTCPGCGPTHLDLSEAGIAIACGRGADICDVTYAEVP